MQQQKFGWRFGRVSELLLLHHEFLHDSCHKKLFVKRKIQVIMKQKNFLFAGLCALSLITWEVQAVSILPKSTFIQNSDIEDPPPGYEKIDLLGDLMYNTSPNAIVAGANDEAVYIGFNQDFGLVNISIYNSMGGLVYSAVVNTSVQQVVIIPITFATSGTYTVELSNAFGYADGDFEHE